MTSKEIVKLLCELVDLKELTNRGLILKDINNFQDQLEEDLEVLEIIKSKSFVDFGLLEVCKTPDEYNDSLVVDKLIVDEFYKLKEWLENE